MTQAVLPDFDLPARGNVKAAMKSAAARSADLWQVHPSQLHVMDGFNVRVHSPEYDAHIESLTTSIIENGYFPDRPIAGYVARENGENTIYVTDGHSRLEAVNRAIDRGHAIETIPVIIKPQGTSIEDLTVALVKSNEGRPLGPLEVGAVCKRLMGLGLDEGAIAKRLGFTRGYVNDLLMLVGSAKPLRDLVVEGKVAATLAIEQLKQDPETAQDVLQHAVEQAQAMGKQKATKKHLPKPVTIPEKPEPPKQPKDGDDAVLAITQRETQLDPFDVSRSALQQSSGLDEQQGWIPCGDQLPKNGEYVEVRAAAVRQGSKHTTMWIISPGGVTHWRPDAAVQQARNKC